MKELSIEEKAKRYDDLLVKLQEAKVDDNVCDERYCCVIDIIVPELGESEDERTMNEIIAFVEQSIHRGGGTPIPQEKENKWIAWLEKQAQKPADKVEQKGMNIVEEDMTPFQKKVFCIIDTTIEEEQGLKQVCDELLRLAHDEIKQKPAWSEVDEIGLVDALWAIQQARTIAKEENDMGNIWYAENWLKSLKDRVQPQPKQEWSQNDIDMLDWLIRCCEKEHEELCNDKYGHQDIVSDLKRDCRKKWDWLESLKNRVIPKNRWKPDKAVIQILELIIQGKANPTNYQATLMNLVEQLKKLKE